MVTTLIDVTRVKGTSFQDSLRAFYGSHLEKNVVHLEHSGTGKYCSLIMDARYAISSQFHI